MKGFLSVLMSVLLLLLLVLFSCTKLPEDTVRQDSDTARIKVNIDSVLIKSFDSVNIYASFNGVDSGDYIIANGISWGNTPDSVSQHVIEAGSQRSYKIALGRIGQGRTIYAKAFLAIDTTGEGVTDIIYESKVEKIKTSGLVKLWEKGFPDVMSTEIVKVLPTNDNGLIILSGVYGDGFYWPLLIKIDTAGNVLWSKEYHEGEERKPLDIIKVKDGYVIGTSFKLYGSSPAATIIKTDLNGTLLWENTFPVTAQHQFVRCQLISDNLFKATIRSTSGYTPNAVNPMLTDFWYDMQGNLLRQYGISSNYVFNTFSSVDIYKTTTAADSSYLIGYQYSHYFPEGSSNMVYDAMIRYFDKNNQIIWEKPYGGDGVDLPTNLAVNSKGNFTVLGRTSSTGNGQSLWLFNVDKANGNVLWQYFFAHPVYGKNGTVDAQGIFVNKDDQHYMTGYTSRSGSSYTNMFVLKVGADGRYMWDYSIDGTGLNLGNCIYVSDAQEIYVLGIKGADVTAPRSLYITKLKEF